MVINTNTQALTSARTLGETSTALSKSLARLSSGSRIVSPEDDAAGMSVSMRFDAQINRTGAADLRVEAHGHRHAGGIVFRADDPGTR